MTLDGIDLMVYGTKKNYYIEDATSTGTGNDKFESTTLQEYTVPAGKRWILLYGWIYRDANATVNVQFLDSSGDVIAYLQALSASTGSCAMIPTSASGAVQGSGGPYILDEAEQIQINFGAAQGAGAKASISVLELDI